MDEGGREAEETSPEGDGVEIQVEEASSAVEATGTSVLDRVVPVAVIVVREELPVSPSTLAGLGVASRPHSAAASLSESP